MIISRVSLENKTFINLHAEQSFEGSFGHFLDKNIQQAGVFQNTLSKSTIDKIIDDFKTNPVQSEILIFDFNHLDFLQVNQNINFKENIIDAFNSICIQLLNVNHEIANKLGLSEHINIHKQERQHIFLNNKESFSAFSTYQAFEIVFHETLYKKYLEPNEKYHRSTPVYINKFIDLKKFISNDQKLFIYTLYFLALSMIKDKKSRDWVLRKGDNSIVLFAHNMNSSYIASILANFLLLDVILVDHVGPINKIYSTFDKRLNQNKKYLVVADVVCLGTEVKIAKNIIEFSGSTYLGNVSIVRINTLEEEDKKYSDVETIYVVEKGNNKIGYSISTALD